MVITDIALEEIVDQIALHRPERGGALYGPRNYPLVTYFDFDADATTTRVSYVPSLRLIDRVRKVERETGLKFKGIIHSHPGGLLRPSSGDRHSAANLFRHNPHLASMAMPIVQEVRDRDAGSSRRCIHWYSVERRDGDRALDRNSASSSGLRDGELGVEILDEEFYVLPVREHFVTVLGHLKELGLTLEIKGGLQPLQIEHVQLVGLVAQSSGGNELMYFVPIDYPIVAPVLLYTSDEGTKNLKHEWDGLGDVGASLRRVAQLLASAWGRKPPTEPNASKRQSTTPFVRGLREV